MRSASAASVCCLSCLLLPGVVLQTTGFFSPYWIKQNSTSDCFRGILYTVNCDESIKGLGPTVLGCQTTALIIIALSTIVLLYTLCYSKDDQQNSLGCYHKFGLCFICLYPLSGIISFSGCMFVVTNYNNHEKSWGFHLSLAASCYVVLEIFICCYTLNKLGRSGKDTDIEDVQRNSSNNGEENNQFGASTQDNETTTPSRGGGVILGQVQGHHQLKFTSTRTFLTRKLQVTRVFHIS
ncbi:uncharacterized protein LOC134238187 [Saccostrea cucullata]|uniref:uncharacterized protein LOC134238187 n=1 Tax=Saccostrea cuccullata TaxID=36930 RepID=UPI002ED18EE1